MKSIYSITLFTQTFLFLPFDLTTLQCILSFVFWFFISLNFFFSFSYYSFSFWMHCSIIPPFPFFLFSSKLLSPQLWTIQQFHTIMLFIQGLNVIGLSVYQRKYFPSESKVFSICFSSTNSIRKYLLACRFSFNSLGKIKI